MVSLLWIFSAASLVGLGLLLLLYRRNPVSLLNGFVFDIDIALLVATLMCIAEEAKLELLALLILFVVLTLATIVVVGGIWIVIGFLLLNAVQVFRRERHTLQNMLSLLIGLGLLFQMIVLMTAQNLLDYPPYVLATGLLVVLEFWLAVTAVCFVSSSLLCRLDRPRLSSTDYLIVLGSGLIHGSTVSPLLAGRINLAIRFYQRALRRGFHLKLVFSGGQGADETLPEAEAMKAYALAHGVLEQDTLVETESRSTLENFLFSKAVMDADAAGHAYRCGFSTSNYHVLRARIYARQAGLPRARGLGAHTAGYYVTNATIREYIAVMLNNKRTNAIQLGILTLCYVVLAAVTLAIG